jgi:hypothetical protein
MKMHKGLVEVKEMFIDLAQIVRDQEVFILTVLTYFISSHLFIKVEIDEIFDNTEQSNMRTREAFEHLIQANKLQRDGNCIIS